MKPVRLLLVAAGALVVLAVLALAVASSSKFQTWVVRRELAARPELATTIGSIDAGLRRVTLRDVRVSRAGMELVVPSVETELPLFAAAFSEKLLVSRLVATGWTLDLSRTAAPASAARASATPPADAPPAAAAGTNAALHAFMGIFGLLRLPLDLALDGVDLAGTAVLPQSRGNVKLAIKGGGLAAGREGKFELTGDAALKDPAVNSLKVQGTLVAAMDTPRSFTQLAAKLDAAAKGASFPNGVSLTAGLTAARAATGESYSATIVTHERQIVAVKAEFPRDASRLEGTWKLDARDADLAPFALGHALPAFSVVGEGRFDADARFAAVHATGRLNATAGKLEVLQPSLAAIGSTRVVAEFDLTHREHTLAVQQLQATISATQPVATVTTLQSFEFNPSTGELRASDPAGELVGVVVQGLPLAWLKPLLAGLEISGADLRGELMASARGGGMAVRTRAPLVVERLSASQEGKPWARDVDVSLSGTADYTPQGWQAEFAALTVRDRSGSVLTLNGKAGQLAGAAQALKATAKLELNLPAVLRQPIAANTLALEAGNASIDLIASLGERKELQAKVSLQNLGAGTGAKRVSLPSLQAEVRADLTPEGRIALNAPIALERDGRKSDLTLVGSIGPEKDKTRAIEANATSAHLVVDDAKLLAALLPEAPKTEAAGQKPRATAPPWQGVHGVIALQLKKVVYSELFEMTNVAGRIRLEEGVVRLETVQLGLGETGRAALHGAVTFDPRQAQPYGMRGEVQVRDFDPGPIFRAPESSQAPIVEGRFDFSSQLAGRATSLADLPRGAVGDFQLTSKSGIFRGLPVNAATLAENTSKIASWLASAGTALGALAGKKDYSDIANKSQAVAEVARALSAITYDQLSVVVSRDAALNTTLRDFSLISPELRLTGSGTATHHAGSDLLDDALAMEFKLRARGRQGALLRYLGALEPQVDDLGYSACTVPLKVGGTIGKPDTTELNGKLATLALEKSGVTEKASEIFNRIIGGGK